MEPKKESTVRRDRLLDIEKEAHGIWKEKNFFERNPNPDQKKYMVTFPYPYMNGRLHLGHAYSMSKAEFTIRYKRLKGYNALWPFAFHCTGMPIGAAAIKLQREFEKHGDNLKTFADETEATFKKEMKELRDQLNAAKTESEKTQIEKKFQFSVKLTQYTILKMCAVPEEEIPKFKDPDYWLSYFPEVGKQDLKRFGVHADFRRSFITTSKNPYYDNFIQWQFRKLKERNFVDFGKRPTIFSPADRQPCADHDRSEGEGVNPQEYTGIKLRLLEFPGKLEALKDRKVFLVAATLRPETMYGQTNCFILPTGKYGAYEMQNDEVFIVSERAARNMSYQELTKEPEKLSLLLEVEGTDLIGLACKAPLTPYEKIYLYPMLSISMEKGTGIVTSVPSDAPDDWVNLKDLQAKPEWRKKWNLTDEMVLPFKPIPIMEVPELGELSALAACEKLKVGGPNDKVKLAQAKDLCYDSAFYKGVMLVGKYKGQKVFDAKTLIKADLVETGEACPYWEPDGRVAARNGEPCVVAFCDQWYLKYGEPEWQKAILDHVNSSEFNTYNSSILKAFQESIGWLKEWAFSRIFGQGTRVPWDQQFLIESLSDSTIYMAYYTIAHYLQSDIEGNIPGTLGVEPKDINDDIFDYVFLGKDYKPGAIPEDKLKEVRNEFNYWYPMDLRVSAKDLVRNHLTMCLYNHAAIWPDQKYWPRGFFCNGYIMVNGEKMSKQKGNFLTLDECINKYGSDATRVALADAGDTLDDANFVEESANASILKISQLETWIIRTLENIDKMRGESADEHYRNIDFAYLHSIDEYVHQTDKAYEAMRFRDVLKFGLHGLSGLKEDYTIDCGDDYANMNKNVILKYIEQQLLVLYPICPHFSEVIYNKLLRPHLKDSPEFISQHKLPDVDPTKINYGAIRSLGYLKNLNRVIKVALDKFMGAQKKEKIPPKKCNIIIASKYFDWQIDVLKILNECQITENNQILDDWKAGYQARKELDKDTKVKGLKFGTYIIGLLNNIGREALAFELPFVEKQLIVGNINNLQKTFNIKDFEIVEAIDHIKSENKLWNKAANDCLPGQPTIIFE